MWWKVKIQGRLIYAMVGYSFVVHIFDMSSLEQQSGNWLKKEWGVPETL